MIYQNSDFENSFSKFSQIYKDLHVSNLLLRSNISKRAGYSANQIFRFLIQLVFLHKNLYQSLYFNSRSNDTEIKKNTFYRFMSEPSYNWLKFLLLLAVSVIQKFSSLTNSKRVKVLILDDSVFSRNRSKKVELLARIYDHVFKKYVKGFYLLTLGWSDGYSFIPVMFNLLSSADDKNVLCPSNSNLDKRSTAYKIRQDSRLTKPDAAFKMVKKALDAGINADYVLMDTWFTQEPLIKDLKTLNIDVIGMVKQLNQRYKLDGKHYTLNQLANKFKGIKNRAILGSVIVHTGKHNIPVKIVFLRHRSDENTILYLLSTDCSLSNEEIVRTYGKRWKIEEFFKVSKHYLKLDKAFQCRDYTSMVCQTSLVFTRYIFIEWLKRNENDDRTFGNIFYIMCDEVHDIDFTTALRSIFSLLSEVCNEVPKKVSEKIQLLLNAWLAVQPKSIQCLLSACI